MDAPSLAEAAVNGILAPTQPPPKTDFEVNTAAGDLDSFRYLANRSYADLIRDHVAYPTYEVIGYAWFPLIVPAWVIEVCLEQGAVVLDSSDPKTNRYTFRWTGLPT